MGKRKAPVENDDVCPMDIDSDESIPLPPAPKKRKTAIPKILKIIVWDRTFGLHTGKTRCPVCNHREISQMDFQCGHIIPECLGGETVAENLQPICQPCNLSMGKKHLAEFKKKYFK